MKSIDYCCREMEAPSEQQLDEWKSLVANPTQIEERQGELYEQLFGQRTADGRVQLQLSSVLANAHVLVEDASTGLIRSFSLEGASFSCVKCRSGNQKQRRYVRVTVDAEGIKLAKHQARAQNEHTASCHGESKADIVLKQLSRRLRRWTEKPVRPVTLDDAVPAQALLDFTLAIYEERLEGIFSELIRLYDANLPPMVGSGEEGIAQLIRDPSVVHIIVRNEDTIVAGLSFSRNDHFAEIHLMAVDQQQRRRGIGRECIQELMLLLQTPQYHVPIIAVQSDEEARGFYSRVGFLSPSDAQKEALQGNGLVRFMGTLRVRTCEQRVAKAQTGSNFGKRKRK